MKKGLTIGSGKDILKIMGMSAVTTLAATSIPQAQDMQRRPDKPNIIYILTDDLGWGELGCYGQQKIKTPCLDSMANNGMRFTQAYSGAPVCAPARCSLMQGRHMGHAYIRANEEMSGTYTGQRTIPDSIYTVAEMLKGAGYTTGMVGKWGLGGPGTGDVNDCPGLPTKQGFDFYYGHLCQRHAHQYYPTYLWKNTQKDNLDNPEFSPHQKFPTNLDPYDPANYERYKGNEWAEDMEYEEAVNFIRTHKDSPFFLYYASNVPHTALQAPDSAYEPYIGQFSADEEPYDGTSSYLPHRYPLSCYAGMITRFDQHVGEILALLEELGIDSNTLVIYTSDNGTTYAGGVDREYFNSMGPLRGLKYQLYEGGIRVPMIAWWPGKIEPGSTSGHPCAMWDMLPTFAELAGCQPPRTIDGISIVPTLLGSPQNQRKHEWFYWEFNIAQHRQAVLIDGRWKCVRYNSLDNPYGDVELYDLENDIGETNNIASSNPEICDSCQKVMRHGRVESEFWPFFPSYTFEPWEWGNDPVSTMPSSQHINGSLLYQNYPNPFTASTRIKYTLNKDTKVSLMIYNSSGRVVRTLVDKRQVKGNYTFSWDGSDDTGKLVKSGTYFMRLKVDGRLQIRKVVIVR